MKSFNKGILLLSLVSISFGLNITSNKNSNELKLSSFSNKRISKANINADSKLKVTLLDGGDASDRYEVKEKGYGCISTVITSPGDYLITQIDTSKAINEQIVIGPYVTGTIKLSNLNLLYSTSSEMFHESTIQVDPTSNVTLFFDGDNNIRKNGNYYPAIGYYGNKLEFSGKLTIEGSEDGFTNIRSALYGSGIGGVEKTVFSNEGGKEKCDTVGEIVVNSGNFDILAFGSGGSAIGSGTNGHINGITINGGNLNLNADGYKGSASGAVIGSADGGSCDNITINGGRLIVSNAGSYSSSAAAAIGAGSGGECKEVIINGGLIDAESYDAPAIGLGRNYFSDVSIDQKIIINGGTISTEVKTGNSKGIGSYYENRVPISTIEINGGSIKSSFTIDPLNKEGERVYLAKIDDLDAINDVYVGDTNFNISANHLYDSSLYLYLPPHDSKIKVNDSHGEKEYQAKYLDNQTFEVIEPAANEAPIINAEDKYIKLNTLVNDDMLLKGVSVKDDNDTNLIVKVKSHNVDSSTIGTYEVTYTVTDSGNLTTEKTVKVYVYADFEVINNIPVIKGENKTIPFGSKFDDNEALKGISAFDEEDEDLTKDIKVVSNPVNTSLSGEYDVTYSVTDSKGATGYLTIKVRVLEKPTISENDKPVITVKEFTLNVNDKFDDTEALKYVSAVDKNGEVITNIEVILNEVDTSKVGEYKLGFKATDRNGVSQEKYVTIKVIKKEDNNTLAIIILTSFIVIVLAIGGITVFIIKKVRKSK